MARPENVVPLPEPKVEERPVLVVDLGGQYSQLIARRVREARVYSELVPYTITPAAAAARKPLALILSGGPASVYAEGAPHIDPGLYELGVPVLGICYGMQLMALDLGGAVERTDRAEFGRTELEAERDSALFLDLPEEQTCWMSHRDSVSAAPTCARVVGGSPNAPISAFEAPGWLVQLLLPVAPCQVPPLPLMTPSPGVPGPSQKFSVSPAVLTRLT